MHETLDHDTCKAIQQHNTTQLFSKKYEPLQVGFDILFTMKILYHNWAIEAA